ncbi:unnamed protein product [Leptidea sinapis]|uniref:Uncharacterized protein n=1 Tax=Leptidea sinapis TaxID=189913 RepID=A0A5E4R178_9NEOP|nr:unnamed protein product [Leptidea sinapis]
MSHRVAGAVLTSTITSTQWKGRSCYVTPQRAPCVTGNSALHSAVKEPPLSSAVQFCSRYARALR